MLFQSQIENQINDISKELSLESARIVIIKNKEIEIFYNWVGNKTEEKSLEWLREYKESDIDVDFIIVRSNNLGVQTLLSEVMFKHFLNVFLVLEISNSKKTVNKSASLIYHLLKIKLIIQDYFYNSKIKEKELFLNEILNVFPKIIFITNLSGDIKFANKRAIKLLGFSNHEILTKNINNLSSDSRYDERNWRFTEARQSEQLLLGINLQTSQGKIVPIDAITHFISDKDHDYFISFVSEIKDRKQGKAIFQKVVEAQNTERKRFAKDLHDGLGPLLSLIKLYISDLNSEDLSKEEQNQFIQDIIKLIDDAILSAKRIANNLVPSILKEYGLVNAIENFIRQINKNERLEITLTVKGINELLLNVQMEIYQVVRELLNNALKHSEAKKVKLKFSFYKNHLVLHYFDNGKGFNYKKQKNLGLGMGLSNLNSRVEILSGTIDFKSELGEGTEILIKI